MQLDRNNVLHTGEIHRVKTAILPTHTVENPGGTRKVDRSVESGVL